MRLVRGELSSSPTGFEFELKSLMHVLFVTRVNLTSDTVNDGPNLRKLYLFGCT